MSGEVVAGIGLTMVAGVMAGNCMLPMKFTRQWRWENVWLIFSIFSLLVLPWGLALGMVHGLLDVYRQVRAAVLAGPFLLGAGWGVAQILFGASVRRLGLGLGYAIIVGLGAVLGTLVPLFLGQRELVTPGTVARIVAGVAVMVAGIALTAWGGQIRERSGRQEAADAPVRSGYAGAVLLAVLCGVMAPMLNYAFAFGQGIAAKAVLLGNSQMSAGYAVWPIALTGGLIPNVGYSMYLLRRSRSWTIYRGSGAEVMWPVLMAVLWMGSMALYGMSAVYLGGLGTSIGWGLFQIFMIMTATVSGLLTAEWRDAPRAAILLLGSGMAGLIGATVLLSVVER